MKKFTPIRPPKFTKSFVVQEFVLGDWDDVKEFPCDKPGQFNNAVTCMRDTYALKRRQSRVIERCERVRAKTK